MSNANSERVTLLLMPIARVFQQFLSTGAGSSLLLMGSVIGALTIANSPAATAYDELLNLRVGFDGAGLYLNYSLLSWINEGLMALFFLLVGLEIKRELIKGELASFQRAILPVLAALGSVIVPVLL